MKEITNLHKREDLYYYAYCNFECINNDGRPLNDHFLIFDDGCTKFTWCDLRGKTLYGEYSTVDEAFSDVLELKDNHPNIKLIEFDSYDEMIEYVAKKRLPNIREANTSGVITK